MTTVEKILVEHAIYTISECIRAVLNERKLYIVKPQHPTMGEVALEAYGFGKACDAVALEGDDLQALLLEIDARCADILNRGSRNWAFGSGTLAEPRSRALIACQIRTGPGQTWTDRTYEVVRAPDGQWLVDFGDGPLDPRRDWNAVLDWLWRLSPRDIELLEEPCTFAI